MSAEKSFLDIPYHTHQHQLQATRNSLYRSRIAKGIFLALASLVLLLYLHTCVTSNLPARSGASHRPRLLSSNRCTQVDPLHPKHTTAKLSALDAYLQSDGFRNGSITRLSDAVKVPTVTFDDMGPIGEDARWDIFYDFAAYLQETFPLVHDNLDLERVNVHGLLYTWQGSDPELKPTLLMAHQDVVPVPESTVDAWTHPPFGGVYDGRYIWGRGSSDCKNQLIAMLEAVESLLKAEFQPRRTVILPFGFDEEISTMHGAGHLAPFLLDRYGRDSVAAILDEGAGIADVWGTTFAMPGVAEKGYLDVEIVVRMPGGHSSIPPAHNGIGVMSELITLIEGHPYEPQLYNENPYLRLLHCGAEYAQDFPPKLKKLLSESDKRHYKKEEDKLAREAAKANLATRYLMTTSVAVDVINGGVKVNALPERTSTIVNHRINVGEHPAGVKAKLAHLAGKITEKYNLTLHAFNASKEKEEPSSITLTALAMLEPAPVTPTVVDSITAYSVVSGTTRALYGEKVLMAPGMTTGNTDTRYYWDLSRHIFRYSVGWDDREEGGFGNIHTVNEKISVKTHLNAVRWYTVFIRNMDEADLEQ